MLVTYFLGAVVYAIASSSAVALAGMLLRRPLPMAAIGLSFSAFLVLFLGLHPFPDPATLDCSGGGRPIEIRPFAFLEGYARFYRDGVPLQRWFQSLTTLSPVMNFILFMPMGICLAWARYGWAAALAFSFGITCLIELTQVSGFYGLYPCPYRYFETDDLILNTSGAMAGFGLAALVRRRRARLLSRSSPGGSHQ